MAWFNSPNLPLKDWRGKRVWIVGASTGIGEATAAALHARGARVIVSARQEAVPGAQAVPLDATDRQAVQAAAQQVVAMGPLDCVLYCAGFYSPVRSDTMDMDLVLRHMEVNYNGALYVLDAVLPQLLAQGTGHISLVGSVAGYRGLPNSLGYGSSKAALIQLAETLHLELGERGIGVSVVNPGFVKTPLTAQNRFKMPALLTPQQAARAMLRGWASGAFEIHFPKRFTLGLKLLRLLPYRFYFALVRHATL
jgi:NAD(P)-dependent dehydrogenase (short-subunit alcohol dehydrogenase family)